MGGLASALGSGFSQLFKGWGKGIGKAVDNYLVGGAEARKAISDEVRSKFKPNIDLARAAENKRAANIKDLGDKLAQSKQELADAQKAWKNKYDAELASAQNQRQTDIADYKAQLQEYQNALDKAKAGKRSISDQLKDQEDQYDLTNTIFTDVRTGKSYISDPFGNGYRSLDSLTKKERKDFLKNFRSFDNRLIDFSTNPSGRVINAFDKSAEKNYGKYDAFNAYKNRVQASHNTDLRNAENEITRARGDLSAWKKQGQPKDWDDTTPSNNDLTKFESDFRANNAEPTEYRFNGKTYGSEPELDKAYQDALKHEEALQKSASKIASKHISDQKAEIAKRIQAAKNIKKAKLALGALGVGAGAGALYAGARAIYGGDDTDTTDNTDNTDNIDNIDNTYTGKPDPDFNVEKEGQALLKDRQQAIDGMQQMDTGFDPDKAEAVLADAAYDKGVEDGSSVKASDIVAADGNSIDDGLFELLKAMKDPYKADAIANYIYSRHGNDPEVQNRGWRAWLNRYGDSLRSKMGIDPSGYKGMHISGGL